MTSIKDINQLHYLLVYYDEFNSLKGKTPKKTWIEGDEYKIEYECGYLFSAPKDFVDILCDGAVNDKNPIIDNTKPHLLLMDN